MPGSFGIPSTAQTETLLFADHKADMIDRMKPLRALAANPSAIILLAPVLFWAHIMEEALAIRALV
jgi:hypothetical protein